MAAVILATSVASPGMARRRRGRKVDGILPLDKPLGMSSNQALQQAKRLFKAAKAGHTGSLDPLASGVLPLCFGEATKFSSYLLDSDKTYEFDCALGDRTATGDTEGEVVESLPVPTLSEDLLESTLKRFRGEISQIPPMYSALKHQGKRLYELARAGQEVERIARPVTIYELSLLSWEPGLLKLRARCSKGTYIRVLAEDIAHELGSAGHVTRLRRVAAGPFTEADLVDLDTLAELAETPDALDAWLKPVDTAVACQEPVVLGEDASWYFRQGNPVQSPGLPATTGQVRVYGAQEVFLGLGEILDDGRLAPRRLVNFE